MKTLKRYLIIRCKSCGKSSLTTSHKLFKCNYCNKSEKIFKKREWGIAVNLLFETNDRKEALARIRATKDLINGHGAVTNSGFYSLK